MRKEELRHDPVREKIVKSVEYIKDNQSAVLKIFAGLVVLVALFSYFNYVGKMKIDNASEISGLAQNTFINGNIDEALVKFERILSDYPSTSGAAQSLIYLISDAISQENYSAVTNLISQLEGGIDGINDSVLKSTLYKILGDIALIDNHPNDALSYYRMAEKNSKDITIQVKYKLDVISALLIQKKYDEARSILEDILNIEDAGYNEKNKAEELIAFVNHKLST